MGRLLLPAGLALLIGATPAGAMQEPVDSATFEAWMSEVSNWGRWGIDDELGTLNLITDEKRAAAASLIRTGAVVSLARELETSSSAHNTYPLLHEMTGTGLTSPVFSGDRLSIRYHGLAHSHLDALAHAFHDGRMYNGYSQTLVDESGARRNSITAVGDGIIGRGVLIDVPWLRGVEYLEPDEAIYPEELEEWVERTGVRIEPGDVVLVRTGRWARVQAVGEWSPFERLSGLHASTALWLKERDVGAVGSDGGFDVLPSGVEGEAFPLHKLLLVSMGTPLFDNLDLEALSRRAVTQNRWEFFFATAPLRVVGGVGSPLNPVAIF